MLNAYYVTKKHKLFDCKTAISQTLNDNKRKGHDDSEDSEDSDDLLKMRMELQIL